MASLIPDVLLIPYGVDAWSLASLTVQGFSRQTVRLNAPFPCMAINRAQSTPLRLNNSPYELGSAPLEGADLADVIHQHLRRLCRPWDGQSQRFLDAYFNQLDAALLADADTLQARLALYEGLFSARDFLFSAPRPLPRAFLYAPVDAAAPPSEADFVQVDFAFWTGRRIVALLSSQSNLTPAKLCQREERLVQAGIFIVKFSAAELNSPEPFFERVFGGPLSQFWADEPIPTGPFRPVGLDL